LDKRANFAARHRWLMLAADFRKMRKKPAGLMHADM
jgi:hypothetical protein